MRYVLDTNILSPFRKKKRPPSLTRWVAAIGWQDLATTVVTIAEIQCGAERARKNGAVDVAADIDGWLDQMLADGGLQILPMGIHAARLLGKMYETPSLRDFTVADPQAKNAATGADLAVAAIAIAEGGVVVTDNVAHFVRIHNEFQLPGLFNPLDGEWHVRPLDNLTLS
ncbi:MULTISPECIES: PIN domain-containing protein [Roseomonas]|uniref:PIN domain-containing protein n=1 Tax=Roseomonas TaxID=125216 RepID=UPI0028CCF853|nr:PIN domain-containing protein [Roseomonas mucosa]MDT8312739.1 PIN domain-containing protein [Roseomonas mucosa]MDT8351173.1 PIN domain-containing protein [Roseomonas mucosa]MDT8360108.1 PIN domain-containing protein [Roseomonas mucosa]